MENSAKETISHLRERANARLEKSTPGEQAIICMLMVISAQLESIDDVQESFAKQFNQVSAAGRTLLTEHAS